MAQLCGASPTAGLGRTCVRPAFHKGQHSFTNDLALARSSRGMQWPQAGRGDSNPRCESCMLHPQVNPHMVDVGFSLALCVACNNDHLDAKFHARALARK